MNKMKRLTGRKILLVAVAFCAFGFAKAQDTQTEKNTLTLTLDKALEIALDENPTMKVAAEEIALKRVASKEAWQSLLPEASIAGSLDHTIKAAEMRLNDMSFKMGQDGSNTANAGLSINLPLFVPGVYRAMSMTKTDIELAVETISLPIPTEKNLIGTENGRYAIGGNTSPMQLIQVILPKFVLDKKHHTGISQFYKPTDITRSVERQIADKVCPLVVLSHFIP